MIFSIFLISAFLIVLLIKNPKNKYAWIYGLAYISLNIMFFAILIYIAKLSNFRPIFSFEYEMYKILQKIHIGFYTVLQIFNIGAELMMVSMWCFVNFTGYNKKLDRKKTIIKFILTFLPILLYMVITSYEFSIDMYIITNTTENVAYKKFLTYIVEHIRVLSDGILIFYLVMPFFVFKQLYAKAKRKIRKNQYNVMMVSLILMDAFYTYFFLFGPFSQVKVSASNILTFDKMFPSYSAYVYIYLPISILIIFDVVTYLLIKYKILDGVDFMQRRSIVNNSTLMTQDIRHIFHSYKNALLSIKILEKKISEHYGQAEGKEELEQINTIVTQLMNSTGKFLNMFSEMKLNVNRINIIECLNKATAMCVLPENVRIVNIISENELYIFGDSDRICEMFINVIMNSVDAICAKGEEHGEIVVSIALDDEWIYICISDNGTGINKKNLKKIFKPLYSTKKTYTNWGMGLSYVSSVMKAHLGFVFAESEEGKGTQMQFLFPNDGNGE